MRPIVSSIGSLTYSPAKFVAKIIKALAGKNIHNVESTKQFVERVCARILRTGEIIISFDVRALFTSVPLKKIIEVIQRLLERDKTLRDRTNMSISNILALLAFCLENTYFVFRGEYYEQIHGAAMGSPVSPIVANIYMEYFENIAIPTAPTPPRFWDRFVDDTSVIAQKDSIPALHEHINDVDKDNIQFTKEEVGPDGGVPFLDVYCIPNEDGSISTRVYRKPTHTDLYLNWNSHHPVSAKLSVVKTLFHRANVVSSTQDLLDIECKHLTEVLKVNDFPQWAITQGQKTIQKQSETDKDQNKPKSDFKGYTVVPYVQGLSEHYKRILESVGVRVYFKGAQTLKGQLVKPKDKDPQEKVQDVVYFIPCGSCNASYIGETGRSVEERYADHLRGQSALHSHFNECQHTSPGIHNVKVLCKESNDIKRKIKEALYIKVNDPVLNRNIGKYTIPDSYDKLLKEKGGASCF